ncbi:MAG: nuclear transport factor 2 family protein [Gammaproteobacteria bacterium]|nr:nuclear transport factor 2 family protein [Gammaproteobacteria bacterium]
MKITSMLGIILTGVFTLGSGAAIAQAATDDQVSDQADVWALVEQQWAAEEKGDDKWLDNLLTDDFSGWGKASPAPRGKASTKMWNRFGKKVSKMIAHELYPLSIVVHDDVAIAHYMYTSASKDNNKEGKIETINGRYTDILVRTNDGWQFIAWAGGEDD